MPAKAGTQNQSRRVWLLYYAPLFLWIGLIFYLSSSEGSFTQTSRFIRPLLEFLFPAAPEELLPIYHGYIRKAAHFIEYAVLGFLALHAFRNTTALKKYSYISAIACVLIIAILDELNQSLISSRTGTPWDVLLDLCGGLIMILFLRLFSNLPQRTQS